MTSISINGVSATDFLAFYGEVRRVVDNDYDRVEFALCEQTQLDEPDVFDVWERFPMSEALRITWEQEERRWTRRGWIWRENRRFVSKRKEVK